MSPFAAFRDATYEDFLASAVAIGPALAAAGDHPLGATIRAAVEATARWAPSNTNLGLVLLLAPLARAALRLPADGASLRTALAATLAETTVADAQEAYAAIRRAAPGGLGRFPDQDVASTPTVTLGEAMALAAERDAVAREYATDFQTTFDAGAPALRRAFAVGLPWSDAVVETYLTLLAAWPDTHIARKLGPEEAVRLQRRARGVIDAGGVRTPTGQAAIAALDRELRDEPAGASGGKGQPMAARKLFTVAVTKDNHVFASAHFITFPGHRCETLHGHNYRTRVLVEGGLDPEAHYVVDFSELKQLMKRLTDELDHKVLLPIQNPKLQVREEGDSVAVAVNGRPRYIFPKIDCALLPIPNTTVEMLAQYLAGRVCRELTASPGVALRAIEVEVEENFGQSATYRESLE